MNPGVGLRKIKLRDRSLFTGRRGGGGGRSGAF